MSSHAALHNASKRGDVERVKALLKKGHNPNTISVETSRVPLHEVLSIEGKAWTTLSFENWKASISVVQELLKKGARPDMRDAFGSAPLHYAALWPGATMMRVLVQGGADPDSANASFLSPLHLAAARDDHEAVRALIDFGCSVEPQNLEGITPLRQAVDDGRLETVETLMAARADMLRTDTHGRNCLHACALTGRVDVLRTLLRTNPHHVSASFMLSGTDRNGDSPLHIAIRAGHKDMVYLLLKKRVYMGTRNAAGETPLSLSIADLGITILRLLLKAGADSNAHRSAPVSSSSARSLLQVVLSSEERQTRRSIAALLLLRAGADPLYAGKDGVGPLHLAAANGFTTVCEELLRLGGKGGINALGGKVGGKVTPLFAAILNHREDMLSMLIDAGGSIDAVNARGQKLYNLLLLREPSYEGILTRALAMVKQHRWKRRQLMVLLSGRLTVGQLALPGEDMPSLDMAERWICTLLLLSSAEDTRPIFRNVVAFM